VFIYCFVPITRSLSLWSRTALRVTPNPNVATMTTDDDDNNIDGDDDDHYNSHDDDDYYDGDDDDDHNKDDDDDHNNDDDDHNDDDDDHNDDDDDHNNDNDDFYLIIMIITRSNNEDDNLPIPKEMAITCASLMASGTPFVA
jgi:hypothetical protein